MQNLKKQLVLDRYGINRGENAGRISPLKPISYSLSMQKVNKASYHPSRLSSYTYLHIKIINIKRVKCELKYI